MYLYRLPPLLTENRAPYKHQTQATVKELEALRAKYGSLLTTAKSHEEMAGRAAREGQLRAEEVRRFRAQKLGARGTAWEDCARPSCDWRWIDCTRAVRGKR